MDFSLTSLSAYQKLQDGGHGCGAVGRAHDAFQREAHAEGVVALSLVGHGSREAVVSVGHGSKGRLLGLNHVGTDHGIGDAVQPGRYTDGASQSPHVEGNRLGTMECRTGVLQHFAGELLLFFPLHVATNICPAH